MNTTGAALSIGNTTGDAGNTTELAVSLWAALTLGNTSGAALSLRKTTELYMILGNNCGAALSLGNTSGDALLLGTLLELL